MKNKKLYIVIVCIIVLVVLAANSTYGTLSKYMSGFDGSLNNGIVIRGYGPLVNGEFNPNVEINLANTITNSKPFAPGAEGEFEFTIDFSKTDYDVDYVITYNKDELPSKLIIYIEGDGYSNELDNFENTYYVGNDENLSYKVYWYWDYEEENYYSGSDNTDDYNFMENPISLSLDVNFTQRSDS